MDMTLSERYLCVFNVVILLDWLTSKVQPLCALSKIEKPSKPQLFYVSSIIFYFSLNYDSSLYQVDYFIALSNQIVFIVTHIVKSQFITFLFLYELFQQS